MKRLSVTAATIALATSLLSGPPVAAGGAATVRVDGPSIGPVTGVPWQLELEVLQHGVTPIDWERVSLVARQPATGMVTAANGHPGDKLGRYRMEVVFPDAGEWTMEFGLLDLIVMPPERVTVSVVDEPSEGEGRPVTIGSDAASCD